MVSFHTYVNVGSVDDPGGEPALAHMFEHMAFKGTHTIGTKNWPAEKKAMDAVERVYDRLDAERNKGLRRPIPRKSKRCRRAWSRHGEGRQLRRARTRTIRVDRRERRRWI